jgi:hypothetical protein
MPTLADQPSTSATFSREFDASEEDHIRVRAYYLWLDRGCPHGADGQDWFAAQQQQLTATTLAVTEAPAPTPTTDAPAHFSIRQTVAEHLSDPTHRFHPPGTVHDRRVDVIAGAAPQRMRGRQPSGSLHPQQKKPQ